MGMCWDNKTHILHVTLGKNGRATLAQTSCAKFRTFRQSNAILCPSFSDTLKRQPRIEKINVHRLHV